MDEKISVDLAMRYAIHRDGRLNRAVQLSAVPFEHLTTRTPLYDRSDVSGLPARWSVVDRALSARGPDLLKPVQSGPWMVAHGDSGPLVLAESFQDDQEWADLREDLAARAAGQLIEMMKAFVHGPRRV